MASPKSTRSITDRFWEKVDRRGPDECWQWLARKDRDGYGRFRDGPLMVKAHRFAYEQMVGPIPDGLQIDHLCRNRPCVNTRHLEAVTQRVNILRGNGITAKQARQTHCKRGHAFDEANTYVLKRGERQCRICAAARNRRYSLENRFKRA